MRRKIILSIAATAAAVAGIAPAAASAAGPNPLYLSGGAAFAELGRSCGGIQERVYATDFAPDGYPTGDVHLQTSCGGGGRGGGYKTTTYTAWVSVVWTWLGETRSYGPLSAPVEENTAFSAEDAYGDHLYNVGTNAFLAIGAPPLQAPAPPTGVSAAVALAESGESEFLRMSVAWTLAPETAGLISSSTVTATPVDSTAPVLTTTVGSYWSSAGLAPVQPNTTYRVTVTNTDGEGTSQPSETVEVRSPNSDGEAEHEHKNSSSCEKDSGTIKLSPGLTETPHIQSITVKGTLSECGGQFSAESGSYTAHLQTTEEVTCAALSSASLEPTTSTLSFSVRWQPSEEGTSKGSLSLPISEAALTGLSGSLTGGPFSSPAALSASSLYESFTGASTCGVPQGRKGVVKAVKSGVFSTGEVEL